MKTEFVDVNETRKNVRVEISERSGRRRNRSARARLLAQGADPRVSTRQGAGPGHQAALQGADPADVAHDLIPPAVDEALRERGVEAVDTPDVRDVTVEAGQPLVFTASFDTVPAFEPGDYTTISLQRPSSRVDDEAVDQALQRLRDRAARYEPVEGRGVDAGDTLTLDLDRRDPSGTTDTHKDVNVEIGAAANPPGFDEQLLGLEVGATRTLLDPLSAGLHDHRAGGHRRRVHGDGQGAQAPEAPRARRRVRQGSGASSRRSTRCAHGCGTISSTRPVTPRSGTSGRS